MSTWVDQNMTMNGHHAGYMLSSAKKMLQNTDLASEILVQLNECRLQKQFTDAILSVDEEELHCHRCVLAASSPYFRASFSNHFQEAITARVTLREISPWTMKRILEYIYSGQLEITLDTALDYLHTGHMLDYPVIVEACCDLLSHNLQPSNCLNTKEWATFYECTELETTAYNYVLEHFTSIVEQSDELCKLPLESFKRYLSADNADICSEATIWKAISKWVQFDVDNRKQYLPELLSCVRLSVLTSKELTVIASDPLIRNQTKCVQLLEKAAKRVPNTIKSSIALCDTLTDNFLLQSARPSTLPRDMIVLFGGSSGYELTEAVSYDPSRDRWMNLPAVPEHLVRASITAHDNTIYITGGIANNELSGAMWMFCCKERKWTRGKLLMEPRAKHSSVVMNGVLYLSGGVRMDENQTVVPMTEIHSYHLKTGVWRRAGCNSAPKLDGNLLAINNILYELGGQSDGSYSTTMATYRVTPNGLVTRTDEHYVLPCLGEPGPLKAALHENDLIIILWENTGDLFSINTNGERFKPVNHSLGHLSGCLVAFSQHAYILGGYEDGKPSTKIKVLDLNCDSYKLLSLPPNLLIHKSVRVRM